MVPAIRTSIDCGQISGHGCVRRRHITGMASHETQLSLIRSDAVFEAVSYSPFVLVLRRRNLMPGLPIPTRNLVNCVTTNLTLTTSLSSHPAAIRVSCLSLDRGCPPQDLQESVGIGTSTVRYANIRHSQTPYFVRKS